MSFEDKEAELGLLLTRMQNEPEDRHELYLQIRQRLNELKAYGMPLPDTLRYKIDQFRNSGRIVRYGAELFVTPNWLAVLMGQDIWPERYDPLVDQQDVEELRRNLDEMRAIIRQTAEAAPKHADYIARHCRATAPAAT